MILALETATTACSAALCAADGAVVAESVSLEGPAHAQRLLPGVHEVLAEAGATWADVDTVAVGLGPGAFTGLRIGIATARALAQADGRVRLAGVPTPAALALALANLAEAGVPGVRLVPLIDGRRGEVFAAVYAPGKGRAAAGGPDTARHSSLRLEEDVTVVKGDELGAWLERLGDASRGGRVVVGGDGAALYADRLPRAAVLAGGAPAATAAMVGRAVACGAPGLVWGPAAVLPIYGRTPDAARFVGAARPGGALP